MLVDGPEMTVVLSSLPEMLLANIRRLFLPVLGSKSHIVPNWNAFRRR
jgi:hypothetical protein